MSDNLIPAGKPPRPLPKSPPTSGALEPENPLSALLRRELEKCRGGWEAGAIDALVDALRLCEQHNLPLSDWMHAALAKVVTGYAATRRRSRSRRSMDLRDFHRYDMVTSILEHVPSWTEEAQNLREALAQDASPGMNEQRRKVLTQEAERFERFVRDASWTDRRIFAFAAAELAQDPWHGTVSAEAIKASYSRVKKRLKRDPKGRYYFGLMASRGIEAARRKGAAPIKGVG